MRRWTAAKDLKAWLAAAKIEEAAVFRRVIGRATAKDLPEERGGIGERLSVDEVAQACKRVARWIGLSDRKSPR